MTNQCIRCGQKGTVVYKGNSYCNKCWNVILLSQEDDDDWQEEKTMEEK